MGAISDIMQADAFRLTQSLHGQQVRILSSFRGLDDGKVYQCTLLAAPDVKFQGEVLQDNREKTVAHFAQDSWPKNVLPEDTMKDSDGTIWRFGERTDNPADSTVDFDVVKVTSVDN